VPPKSKEAEWLGQVLAKGRYEIKAKLGEGGMGCVYRARDRKLDTDVIIKVPRPALLHDPEFVARFTREVRALVRLEHPHVVRVMDVDQHGEAPFAVMQFLGGGSLEDRQSPKAGGPIQPMPVEQLRTWLPDVAAALDFVHEQGYVHRDVKPANILFDQRGHAFLSDFGVAKAVAETAAGLGATLTGTGVVLGTPAYMAPEMALGKKFDGRIDQYALAVTVYELLAGRLPFEGATPSAVLLKQTTEPPPRLDQVCPSIPRTVAEAVHRALAKEPEKRFPNCRGFAQSVLKAGTAAHRVQATGKNQPILTQALRAEPMPSKRLRRTLPLLLAIGAAAVVLFVALASMLLISQIISGGDRKQARLTLAQESVTLTPGRNKSIEVRIDRAGHEGPIQVEVADLPHRVSFSTPKIPADWSTGLLELIPAADAEPEETVARITARLGDSVLEAKLQVSVAGPGAGFYADPRSPAPPPTGTGNPSAPNSIGMRFVTIPAGEYARGSPEDDPNAEPNERPQQRVRLTKPFEMAIYEVTVGQFRQFVDAIPGYKTEAESSGEGADGYDPGARKYIQDYRPEFNWRNVGWPQTDNHPVVSVSANDAKAFCEWLTRKEGRTYRLPTEAEWEYAARAGTTSRYWTGDNEDSLNGAENIGDASLQRAWAEATWVKSWDDGYPFTAPVGSFKPNSWGLYDMLGNAGEKASDGYDAGAYRQPSVIDPLGRGANPVFRGGTWFNEARHVRVAGRWGEEDSHYRDATNGFRVVREVGR
jgi:formylglycine-generating enzyme required for sulfatase activity/serine/threonine protein kinase